MAFLGMHGADHTFGFQETGRAPFFVAGTRSDGGLAILTRHVDEMAMKPAPPILPPSTMFETTLVDFDYNPQTNTFTAASNLRLFESNTYDGGYIMFQPNYGVTNEEVPLRNSTGSGINRISVGGRKGDSAGRFVFFG